MTLTDAPTTILELDVTAVVPDTDNLRRTLDQDVIDGIADTIDELGILEPLVVRPADDHWVIVAGHHRHAAALQHGLPTVPCIVRDLDPGDPLAATLLMLVENLQRADLTPVEEAEGYRRLANGGWDQKRIATAVGRSQPVVSKRLALCTLPAPALDALQDRRLTIRQAEDLTKVTDEDTILEIVGAKQIDDWAIRNAVADVERKQAVAAAEAEVTAAGVTVLTAQERWNTEINYVEAGEGETPTHAVIDTRGHITWLLVHQPTDDDDGGDEAPASDSPAAAREAAWQAQNAERERRRQVWTDAAARHETVIRQALTAGTMPKEATVYADRAIVALATTVYLETQADKICDFLELKYAEDEGPRWDNPPGVEELLDYAAISPRGAARALLATVAVENLDLVGQHGGRQGGEGIERAVAIHYEFLAATGYTIPADEQAELDRITTSIEES